MSKVYPQEYSFKEMVLIHEALTLKIYNNPKVLDLEAKKLRDQIRAELLDESSEEDKKGVSIRVKAPK
tara:strand:- start:1443 stop:1646 length:204 start_codon:yes stop_codon:yes gene_type:complete